MAIILNDNIKINAGKPSEPRYLSTGNTTFISISAANGTNPITYRHTGLTVNILGTEYWYKYGVTDTDLIEKKYNNIIPSGDTVTGATNIGFFSGNTGVQTLPINHILYSTYAGNYNSLYNYYYRGTNGYIHVGTPSDNIPKRGYVKTATPVKSWIWNEYTGSGNLLGWILIDGNISNQLGTFQTGVPYYGSYSSYTATTWTTGTAYNNSSDVTINTVTGSLTTGGTYINGGIVFAEKTGKLLDFRTIMTKTPNIINVNYDESFVYLSGTTDTIKITGATNGLTKQGQQVKLGGTITGATTITISNTGTPTLTITDSRATPLGIQYGANYGNTFGARSLVDAGYVTGVTNSGALVKNVCILSSPTYSMTNNDFFVGASGGTSVVLPSTPKTGMVVVIADIANNALTFPITIVGAIVGCNITTSVIDTNSGSLSYVYNGSRWNAFAFAPAI